MYAFAWLILVLPIAGAAASFVAETPRRAASACMGFLGAALVMGLVVLGYRLAHETTSVTPDLSTLTFFSISPDPSETTVFPSTFQLAVGVRVDNLSAVFMPLIAFLILVVQGLGTAMLQRDAAYRRFFWASSALASALIGEVASPGLFQAWLSLGLLSGITLILTLHWWHRPETTGPARRAFTLLLGADLTLLLGLVFVIAKLGSHLGLATLPSGATPAETMDFRVLDPAWQAAASGTVAGVGYRSLVILALLFGLAALVRSAQLPFTTWITGLGEAPLPVLAAMAVSLLAGVLLLVRVYSLLLVTRHAMSVVALVGAVSAVGLCLSCAVSRDIYRIALLSTAAQLSLALTALGAGGYSAGLLVAFVSAPLSLLLLVTAGSLARAYRTRDFTQMGGAWSRMRRTSLSLGLWAVAAAGLDLAGYDVLSSVFLNRFPNGGHLSGAVQVVVAVLAIAALLLTALYAFRLLAGVCAGSPVVRRGFIAEKLTEAEPRLRSLQVWAGVALLAAVLAGLPGITAIGKGRGRVPSLTFSHWIYYGGSRQNLPVSGMALAVAAAVLVLGAVYAILVRRAAPARRWAWPSWAPLPRLVTAAQAAVNRGIALGLGAGDALAAEVLALDGGLVEPLYDAVGEGVEMSAWSLDRLRRRNLRIGLGVALVIVLLLAGASVLAAGGHFPVHTT